MNYTYLWKTVNCFEKPLFFPTFKNGPVNNMWRTMYITLVKRKRLLSTKIDKPA
jgi:hypothetical protein